MIIIIIIIIIIIYRLRTFNSSMWGSLRLAPIIYVTGQIRKHYGFDRKSGVSGLDYFTHARISPLNAHIILYSTIVRSLYLIKDQHAFRSELAHLLAEGYVLGQEQHDYAKDRRGEIEFSVSKVIKSDLSPFSTDPFNCFYIYKLK